MNSNFIKKNNTEKPILKDKAYLPVLAIFIFILSYVSFALYVDYNSNDIAEINQFSGKIESIYNQKSNYYIKISSSEKWIKLNDIENVAYPNLDYTFINIVKKGDSIYKTKNSDSINLYRENERYSFKIE